MFVQVVNIWANDVYLWGNYHIRFALEYFMLQFVCLTAVPECFSWVCIIAYSLYVYLSACALIYYVPTHSFRAYALIYYVPITFNCSGLPCRLYLLVRSLIIFWVEIHGRRNIFTVRFLKFNALRLLFKLLTVNIWAENVSFWGRFSYPIFVQYR